MQGIFQKENTDKALKYGIYRHLPTYEKIIRNLVSFYIKKDKVWINTIIIIMMKSLFFAPRGSFDAFFSDLLSVNVWLTLIFVYLFSSMIYKNKKKTYAKRGRNV